MMGGTGSEHVSDDSMPFERPGHLTLEKRVPSGTYIEFIQLDELLGCSPSTGFLRSSFKDQFQGGMRGPHTPVVCAFEATMNSPSLLVKVK